MPCNHLKRLARPTGMIRIGSERASPLRGNLRASKLLAQFVEQRPSPWAGHSRAAKFICSLLRDSVKHTLPVGLAPAVGHLE